jgi:Diaminopimelate decarboxylase
MKINEALLKSLSRKYGGAFYLLDTSRFEENYRTLHEAFSKIYPNFAIAYSYKTNYTPALCRRVEKLGGYAEVVSHMELEVALRLGIKPSKIIFNGPYKNFLAASALLLAGGRVNLDSEQEINEVLRLAERTGILLNIGLRVNFDIGSGVSRFGFDTESGAFEEALHRINGEPLLKLGGLHCHFAPRSLESWKSRAEGMIDLVDRHGLTPEYIDLGGGLYGGMPESLKSQFDTPIPSFEDYANTVAPLFAEHFGKEENPPQLIIEPGSALAGDCMSFASSVVSIKNIRGMDIATLLGSVYNINPTLSKKNLPLTVYHTGEESMEYKNLDFGGFTCIESDYLYRGYSGALAVGDWAVFENAGSYSVVLKPPFILPNFPVIDIGGKRPRVVKRAENFDDIFHTYDFRR